jgi:hypothetical protein
MMYNIMLWNEIICSIEGVTGSGKFICHGLISASAGDIKDRQRTAKKAKSGRRNLWVMM